MADCAIELRAVADGQTVATPPESSELIMFIGATEYVFRDWDTLISNIKDEVIASMESQALTKTVSFSADGETYSFSTPNDFIPAATAVQVLPASPDAQLYLKYTITPSEIIMICDVCPLKGDNNVSFSITKTA